MDTEPGEASRSRSPDREETVSQSQKNVESAMSTRKLAQDAYQESRHRLLRKCTRRMGDPVGSGLVVSLARPGQNITGF